MFSLLGLILLFWHENSKKTKSLQSHIVQFWHFPVCTLSWTYNRPNGPQSPKLYLYFILKHLLTGLPSSLTIQITQKSGGSLWKKKKKSKIEGCHSKTQPVDLYYISSTYFFHQIFVSSEKQTNLSNQVPTLPQLWTFWPRVPENLNSKIPFSHIILNLNKTKKTPMTQIWILSWLRKCCSLVLFTCFPSSTPTGDLLQSLIVLVLKWVTSNDWPNSSNHQKAISEQTIEGWISKLVHNSPFQTPAFLKGKLAEGVQSEMFCVESNNEPYCRNFGWKAQNSRGNVPPRDMLHRGEDPTPQKSWGSTGRSGSAGENGHFSTMFCGGLRSTWHDETCLCWSVTEWTKVSAGACENDTPVKLNFENSANSIKSSAHSEQNAWDFSQLIRHTSISLFD